MDEHLTHKNCLMNLEKVYWNTNINIVLVSKSKVRSLIYLAYLA